MCRGVDHTWARADSPRADAGFARTAGGGALWGGGLDNIDTGVVSGLGIKVIYAPGSTTTAVAEHAMMLMLSLARRVVALDNAVKAGNWAVRNGYTGIELAGKTLGIIGLGDIGKRTAQLASAFGMKVIYWNRSPVAGWQGAVSLDELMRQSDVISLSVAFGGGRLGI